MPQQKLKDSSQLETIIQKPKRAPKKLPFPFQIDLEDVERDDSDEGRSLWPYGIYYITGEIMERSLTGIQVDLLSKHIDINWRDDIQFYINSPGGVMSQGWALMDIMNSCRMRFRTIGLGNVSSLAAMLLANGTKGMRYVTENTEVMIHQFSSGVDGNFADLTAQQIGNQQEFKRHLKFWREHSKYKTDALVVKYLLKPTDNYLTAEDALKYGIIDHIIPAKKSCGRY